VIVSSLLDERETTRVEGEFFKFFLIDWGTCIAAAGKVYFG
jgi:hypothetical protein